MPRKTLKSEKEAERYALTVKTVNENANLDGGYVGKPRDCTQDGIITLQAVPVYSTKQLTQKNQLLLAAGSITFQEVKAASMIDRRGILRRTSKTVAKYAGIDIISEFSMNLGDIKAMTILLNRFKASKDVIYTFNINSSSIRESFPDTQRGATMLIDRPVLSVGDIADMCDDRYGKFQMRICDNGIMFDLHQFTKDGKISGTPEYPDITSSFGMIPSREQDEISNKKSYDWKYYRKKSRTGA